MRGIFDACKEFSFYKRGRERNLFYDDYVSPQYIVKIVTLQPTLQYVLRKRRKNFHV